MAKLNLLFAYFSLSSAIGFISIIFGLVLILLVNRPVSAILTDIAFKYFNKFFGNKFDNALSYLYQNEKTTQTMVFGPNILLKYRTMFYLLLGIQFLTMGVAYILSEYEDQQLYAAIAKC